MAADIKTFQRVAREAGAAAASGLHITADTPREEKQRQYGLKGPAHQAEARCFGVLFRGGWLTVRGCNCCCPSERQELAGCRNGAPSPAPQVLHAWPPLAADLGEGLPAFCFPHGVRPELLERTPSMSGEGGGCGGREGREGRPAGAGPSLQSDARPSQPNSRPRSRPMHRRSAPSLAPSTQSGLNEVIYSQPYQTHDDHSFVFLMKVGGWGEKSGQPLANEVVS